METSETILISMVNRKNSEMVGQLLGKDYRIIYHESTLRDSSDS